jgi:endonuclease YncB( thermonuclease family)
VIDGETLHIHGERVRILDIDAPTDAFSGVCAEGP